MRKKGSSLVLVLVVVMLLSVMAASTMAASSSAAKTNFESENLNKVSLAAQSGIEQGRAKLDANIKAGDTVSAIILGENNMPVLKFYNNLINCTVTFTKHSTDANKIIINSYATTTNNKYKKTLTFEYSNSNIGAVIPPGGGTGSPDVFDETSSKFTTLKKFMIGDVVTNNDTDILDFIVKPGKDKKTAEEKLLIINSSQYKNNFSSGSFTFRKNSGGGTGIKVNSGNFFEFTDKDSTVAKIKSSMPAGGWNQYIYNYTYTVPKKGNTPAYQQTQTVNSNLYYYVNRGDVNITKANLTSSNALMQTLRDKSKVRMLFVDGNVTIDNIDYITANSYLDRLVIYCTGTVFLKSSDIRTGANGNNVKGDLDICIISEHLNVVGSNIFSYVDGNTAFEALVNGNGDTTTYDSIVKKLVGNITE